ncbi:4'-phosphopantetheinyl transferase superfamily protein [Dermacoccus sp. 147Ba]|uniref:4'-phosphopantetheinyl transferase family protein n=1 Tax=unclassified Dermacoccus TaxID=2643059 RepID=UPI0006423771|nr:MULTISPECIES: 4'-phosphopantetheinyl transferase superfamily protein [unclassified Dermacoccus]KLO61782.1 hypothetical protein AA983_14085 [Dermacoccus sp. PE3]RYI20635.1 4'-phosphopantetheinyl transferase superfamily protein [Dermacoccus sp. 147Ba]
MECVVAEAFTDVPSEAPHVGEADLIARAVEGRRREFITARRCARSALAALGSSHQGPILAGPAREPLWPPGVVGSITHCSGYRAAAVARRDDIIGLGIDAEPHLPLPDGVMGAVATTPERIRLTPLRRHMPEVQWDLILFSAKEAVLKAWFPMTRRWVDFREIDVRLEPSTASFTAAIRDHTPFEVSEGDALSRVSGRFVTAGGFVMTGVAVSRGGK